MEFREGFLKGVKDKIKKDGRVGLREIYSQIYPELSVMFKNNNIEYSYYRIDSAKAAEYLNRYHQDKSKLIVFLVPNFKGNDEFIGYFGLDFKTDGENKSDFLDLIKGGYLLPMSGINPEHYDNPLYRDFFEEWKKKGLEDEIGYPLYANRFQEIVKNVDGKTFENYKKDLENELKIILENDAIREITPDPKLPRQPSYIYFSEKIAWFKLLGFELVADIVMDLLKKKEIDLALPLTFSFFQRIPAFFLYSKGGPVVFSTNDLEIANKAFNDITKKIKEEKRKELLAGEILSWVSLSPPFVSLVKIAEECAKVLRPRLPIAETPSERAKDIYIVLREVDDERHRFSEKFNEILHKTENVNIGNKNEINNIIDLIKDTRDCTKNLTDTYLKAFKYKPERLIPQTIIKESLGYVGNISHDHLYQIAGEIMGKGMELPVTREFIDSFNLGVNIPIDVWKIEPTLGIRSYLRI